MKPMQSVGRVRVAQLENPYHRNAVVAALEQAIPRLGIQLETVGLYVMLSLLWGLLLCVAVLWAV